MKLSLLDRVLYKDTFIGKRYVKAEVSKRDQMLRFREKFNKKDLEKRSELARQIAGKASVDIPEDQGYQMIPKPPFPEVEQMMHQALAIVAKNSVEALRENKKEQLLTRILKKDQLDLDSPFMRFALREDVIAGIARYLGVIPVLTKVDIWYSKSSEGLSNSQLHHCDFESLRQVKAFIYCTEVTLESGPLVVIDANRSQFLRDKIHYRYGQKIPDSVIDPIVPPGQQFVATCEPGTLVFADTSRCFHYGSRVKGEDQKRVAILFQFLRPQSFGLPLKYQQNSPFSHLAKDDMPAYQRMVLGA